MANKTQAQLVASEINLDQRTEPGVVEDLKDEYNYAEISTTDQQRYGKTRRGLTSRHFQLITIGSSIGTGMFVGIGSALARSGPLSVFLGFTFFSCFVLWPLMMCAAELCSWLPVRGSIFQFAERYVDPAVCDLSAMSQIAGSLIIRRSGLRAVGFTSMVL